MPSRPDPRFLAVFLLVPGLACAAGFEVAQVPVARGLDEAPMRIGLWYPPARDPQETPPPLFGRALAVDAPLAEGRHPLIVLSHGQGSWMGNHADTAAALADAGFIVAVPEHPGDTRGDDHAVPAQWLVTRPADLSATIDYLTGPWPGAGGVDAGRIGVLGFGTGGYGALVAGGGLPDLDLAKSFCAGNPREYACRAGMLDGVKPAEIEPGLEAAAGDGRIGAIAVVAPILGFAFGPLDLAAVEAPVQIWSGGLDLRAPHNTNGALIAAGLPMAADVHQVEGAAHASFSQPCYAGMQAAMPSYWAMSCQDAPDFDRPAFLEEMAATLARFFDKALKR
ncbi:alpha/beta hydrolase family protein [Mangrovicoccus algicola]|uniref:Dienelactone hydrolase n=1 Tax=Mangrovicoccus algicola TaxID=2771008 RepID=A0A8J6ZF51_9RHOB|nr:hypothetical protein [Mangrovicoccus algicola]MBE3640406.1 hypothetical protein [Mangrovicoccus algicola]